MRKLPAAVEIPYGSPVCLALQGKACAIALDLADMIGVARREGRSEHGYVPGEMVTIQTDRGIKVQLAADATIMLDGVARRLLAAEPHYLLLRDGKVAG